MELYFLSIDLLFEKCLEELARLPGFEPKLNPDDALEDHILVPLMVPLQLVIALLSLLLVDFELLCQQLVLPFENFAHILTLHNVFFVLEDVDGVVD